MILTVQETTDVLRLDDGDYPQLDTLLLAVNEYLKTATGFDWATLTDTYTEIDPIAKLCATLLLVQWFENPAMIGGDQEMEYGVTNLLIQLQAKGATM